MCSPAPCAAPGTTLAAQLEVSGAGLSASEASLDFLASETLPPAGDAGEDGGEVVRDISPEGGTLVLFDSVSMPHEVLATRGRERYACSGWFHERLEG